MKAINILKYIYYMGIDLNRIIQLEGTYNHHQV